MKKLLVLVSMLIVVFGCAAPPANQNTSPLTNTNAASSASNTPLSAADAIAKEKAVWTALEKKDLNAFAGMLTADYIEVGDDGVYDKAGIVNYLKDLDIASADFSDWKVIPIDKDATLILYNVTLKATYKGKEVPTGPYRASSAWVNRAGNWQGIYYQETLAQASPASPAATSPATTTASPAAKATPSTEVLDPVASEKMAWAALQRKDYDTFASLLDEAQVEVEADGVYDKAGTLKGVRGFDASKYELTDFKNVNLDSDASLVNYVAKPTDPKAPLERSTTIWVKRDGKWRAFFHQGTPAMKASPVASPTTAKTANK